MHHFQVNTHKRSALVPIKQIGMDFLITTFGLTILILWYSGFVSEHALYIVRDLILARSLLNVENLLESVFSVGKYDYDGNQGSLKHRQMILKYANGRSIIQRWIACTPLIISPQLMLPGTVVLISSLLVEWCVCLEAIVQFKRIKSLRQFLSTWRIFELVLYWHTFEVFCLNLWCTYHLLDYGGYSHHLAYIWWIVTMGKVFLDNSLHWMLISIGIIIRRSISINELEMLLSNLLMQNQSTIQHWVSYFTTFTIIDWTQYNKLTWYHGVLIFTIVHWYGNTSLNETMIVYGIFYLCIWHLSIFMEWCRIPQCKLHGHEQHLVLRVRLGETRFNCADFRLPQGIQSLSIQFISPDLNQHRYNNQLCVDLQRLLQWLKELPDKSLLHRFELRFKDWIYIPNNECLHDNFHRVLTARLSAFTNLRHFHFSCRMNKWHIDLYRSWFNQEIMMNYFQQLFESDRHSIYARCLKQIVAVKDLRQLIVSFLIPKTLWTRDDDDDSDQDSMCSDVSVHSYQSSNDDDACSESSCDTDTSAANTSSQHQKQQDVKMYWGEPLLEEDDAEKEEEETDYYRGYEGKFKFTFDLDLYNGRVSLNTPETAHTFLL